MNNDMEIVLLNILFAIIAISFAIVPIAIAMKLQNKTQTQADIMAKVEAWPVHSEEKQLEHAA
ncbi:MAG: hypothetical protein HIU57_02700 [Acidobacteria bacterium]|nr:hypothetical protein [Acidobacteriota bacterium]